MSDDPFFTISIEHQRAHVAACLGYNPSTPDDWPANAIDDLIAYRWHVGEAKFLDKVQHIMSNGRNPSP